MILIVLVYEINAFKILVVICVNDYKLYDLILLCIIVI